MLSAAQPAILAKVTARRVVIVAYPGVELLDVAGPINVFTAADRLLGGRGYRVQLAAPTGGPVASAGGVELIARQALSRVRGDIDTLLVGGGFLAAMNGARAIPPALARLAPRSRRVAAVCGGAFLLGEAGLLRGRRAVTHWAGCNELRRRHPDCQVEENAIFVADGPIWTSAGVTAGLDLTLALVEEDHGAALALEIARWLVMYLRRSGGQLQFSALLVSQHAELDSIARLTAWIGENLQRDLSTEALAQRISMSVRHFSRVFQQETGSTPTAFVTRLRLEAARRSLELTARSSKQIAADVGFGTVETMHRVFGRILGITPQQHRARFTVRQGRALR